MNPRTTNDDYPRSSRVIVGACALLPLATLLYPAVVLALPAGGYGYLHFAVVATAVGLTAKVTWRPRDAAMLSAAAAQVMTAASGWLAFTRGPRDDGFGIAWVFYLAFPSVAAAIVAAVVTLGTWLIIATGRRPAAPAGSV